MGIDLYVSQVFLYTFFPPSPLLPLSPLFSSFFLLSPGRREERGRRRGEKGGREAKGDGMEREKKRRRGGMCKKMLH